MLLDKTLRDKYGVDTISNIYKAKGGHDGDNSIIETGHNKYFLKQYVNFSEERIIEVHKTYQYFQNSGIPTVSPLKCNDNADYFKFDENYCSLFPFINAREISREELNEINIASMGRLLGKMHNVAGDELPDFMKTRKIRKFNLEYFNESAGSLLKYIENVENKSDLERMNINTLKSKISYINSNKDLMYSTKQPKDMILTHRDFHERNLFFDNNGEVLKIFDFDKACGDSRYIEISRTILFVCTAGKFEESNFNKTRVLLENYLKEKDIDKEEMKNALRFYIFDDMCSRWIIEQYYLKGNKRTEYFMQDQHDTQDYFNDNLDTFIQRVSSYL
jgi:Ser/Thr protein kinase RdoA (MazF antagonist)